MGARTIPITSAKKKREPKRSDAALFANIPEELRKLKRWCCWKSCGTDKVPVDPFTGESLTGPTNKMPCWTFEQVVACFANNEEHFGIGFRFLPQDPYIGIDLDECIDPATGEIEQWAKDFLHSFNYTYAEKTPSGMGIHIICRAKIPKNIPHGDIEFYEEKRFLTMTGDELNGTSCGVQEAQVSVDEWYKFKRHAEPQTDAAVPDYLKTDHPLGGEEVTDDDLQKFGVTIPEGVNFEAELKKYKLPFRKRLADGGVSYDYHNANKEGGIGGETGQPCLLYGKVHEANKRNIRCSRFFVKDGYVVHHCFDDDGAPGEHRTRKALFALGGTALLASIGIKSDSAPAVDPEKWHELFHDPEDFLTVPPLSFSIEGFLQNDGSTMIGGLSGHMKTFIMLSIVKALLAGEGTKLWDLFPVTETAQRILYLIPECSLSPFVHRLKLMRLLDYTQNRRLLVRTLNMGPPPPLQDPRLLCAAKGAHVFLDTAMRFADGDESSASDISQGLAKDLFALTAAGSRATVGAHHAPKTFAKENQMSLENILRGSGDLGAMLSTCWAVKLVDPFQNIVHVENVKPRDFQPCGPFQIIARPFIDQTGDFKLFKQPSECGSLQEEQPSAKNKVVPST
jgi:hypothetical protein